MILPRNGAERIYTDTLTTLYITAVREDQTGLKTESRQHMVDYRAVVAKLEHDVGAPRAKGLVEYARLNANTVLDAGPEAVFESPPLPEPKPEPKPAPEPKPESKPERKREPKSEPKPEPKSESRDRLPREAFTVRGADTPKPAVVFFESLNEPEEPKPSPEPKPTPKVAPEPKSAPNPAPKPKPKPKAESKPEPKPEPKKEPSKAPPPMPKPAPKAEPRAEPKPEPARSFQFPNPSREVQRRPAQPRSGERKKEAS